MSKYKRHANTGLLECYLRITWPSLLAVLRAEFEPVSLASEICTLTRTLKITACLSPVHTFFESLIDYCDTGKYCVDTLPAPAVDLWGLWETRSWFAHSYLAIGLQIVPDEKLEVVPICQQNFLQKWEMNWSPWTPHPLQALECRNCGPYPLGYLVKIVFTVWYF